MASENKKIKNATPLDYKGIHFKSILEVSIFKALEENNLEPCYEENTYVLIAGWKPKIPFYRKNILNYLKIQLELWINIIRRFAD